MTGLKTVKQTVQWFAALDRRKLVGLYLAIILIAGFFTYVVRYHIPRAAFWDENYHIASAQKYLDGVVFNEAHPPLGKLLIALGEKIISPNQGLDRSGFVKTDHVKKFPAKYSFSGVRLFPVLFAWGGAALFFGILLLILRNPHLAFVFTSLYLFDNANIVHSRAAMLDSIQIFFIFASLLWFFYLLERKKPILWRDYAVLGIITGLSVSVKANGLVMLLLFPILFLWEHRKNFILLFRNGWRYILKDLPWKAAAAIAGILLVVFSVFYIHFSLGEKIVNNRSYQISKEYRQIIAEGGTGNLGNFPVMLGDYLKYMKNYHSRVPKYKPFNPKENGSRPWGWPFMTKTIRYRWAKTHDLVRYVYLVGNPVIWWFGAAGLFLGAVWIFGVMLFKTPNKDKRLFSYIVMLMILYLGYMGSMISIDRVMYLYHYFIPFFLSLLIGAAVFKYLFSEQFEKNDRVTWSAVVLLIVLIIAVFAFFSPFTYNLQLTKEQFLQRSWFDLWRLEYVK